MEVDEDEAEGRGFLPMEKHVNDDGIHEFDDCDAGDEDDASDDDNDAGDDAGDDDVDADDWMHVSVWIACRCEWALRLDVVPNI